MSRLSCRSQCSMSLHNHRYGIEKKRPMSMLSVMQLSFTRSPVAVWREYGIWQGDRTLGRMMLDKGAVLVKEKTEANEIC